MTTPTATIPYLLVHKEKSGVYTIFRNALASIHPEDDIEVLFNQAKTAICTLEDSLSPAGLMLGAYTLNNPIGSFFPQPVVNYEKQLGKIDETFLRSKAIYWPPMSKMSFLEVTDGKLLVVFKSSAKRASSSSGPIFDRLKRTKLATTAPLTAGQPSKYELNQKSPSEKILDDRPEPDVDIPPISLLYDGFGEFLDIVEGVPDVPGLSSVNMAEVHKAVDDFAQKMCRFYDHEDRRRDTALPCLNHIFAARTGTSIPFLRASAIGSVRTDDHNEGMVVEFKNRSTNINAMPEVEMASYVAHLHAKEMEQHREIFERWRLPCLGMTVVGSDVKFYALVAVDHQYRVVGLTPNLSCIASASEGRDRKVLYRAFAAASVVQARIFQDMESFFNVLPPQILPIARRFPSITSLPKWRSSFNDAPLSFQILGFHPDRRSYRLLYVAETTSPDQKTILIKFTRDYSIELHDFCAKRGHAPRILAFETLPGGWKVIVMDCVASAMQITGSQGLSSQGQRWALELEQLVSEFHKEGLVHGDLRDANIICDEENTMMLVDFDWGGKDGQVSYPTPNLNDELLAGRASGSLKITKDDDIRVLDLTLKKIRM